MFLNSNPSSRPVWLSSGVTGVAVTIAVATLLTLSGVTLGATSARATDSSAMTITAASQDPDFATAPAPNLAVTVSQTQDLVSQGLLVSWTGGKQSAQPGTDNGGQNFLQIAECWGDDPTVPAGLPAQPDRTTCEYGSFLTPGATRDSYVQDSEVAPQDVDFTAPGGGFVHPTYTAIPFRAPNGTVIAGVAANDKGQLQQTGVDPNTNQFFTAYTSNEVKWAGSGADGSGSVKFEVQTVQQSSGIDCGTPIAAADGTQSGKSCWLVVIPRGTADVGESHILHSGLFWDAWKHRIAFRIGFKPIGISCAIGASEKQISGSELVAGAVASWQPALCAPSSGAIYTISTGNEASALAAASDPSAPAALALTSRPFQPPSGTPDPDVYAPIAISGISIAFAIDRRPLVGGSTPKTVLDQSNQTFTSLKLTPRLVAKLLTNSYLDSIPGDNKTEVGVLPGSPGHNARNLTTDPDFLAINDPEWKYEALTNTSLADLLVPQGQSDIAYQLWRYVMADPDAVKFLNGVPDPWGMTVNTYYSTSATVNPSKVGQVYPVTNFPKADPVDVPATAASGELNLITWRPYTNDFDTSGYLTLRGDGQVLGPWDQTKTPPAYIKAVRGLPGFQGVLGLTDTAAAAKYQIVSASLLNPAGAFVSPTTDAMSAAAAAMTPTASQPQVYEYDPAGAKAKQAPTAYPLTMPVYAATNPAQGDADTRSKYAGFINFASTTGQTPGTEAGQLPDGYAPLPAGWRTQAATAAAAIVAGPPPVATPDSSGGDSLSDTSSSIDTTVTTDAGATSPGDPTAAGTLAAKLSATKTPRDPDSGGLASVVPLSLLAGLLSSLAYPVISRLRRRL